MLQARRFDVVLAFQSLERLVATKNTSASSVSALAGVGTRRPHGVPFDCDVSIPLCVIVNLTRLVRWPKPSSETAQEG
jgi:hypothetical protein